MPRILFVTYHFPPSVGGGISRILSFTRDLPRLGWQVSVLTSTSHGAAAVDPAALSSLPDTTQIVRAYCPLATAGTRGHERVVSGVKGMLRRAVASAANLAMVPDPFAPWIPFAVAEGRRALAREPVDAILATFGPAANLIVGALLARMHGLPLILDYRDLWNEVPFVKRATPAHAAALRAIESNIVGAASGITTVSDGMSCHIRERFELQHDRVVTVLNGFDEDTQALIRDARTAPSRPFVLCYSGAVYAAYDMSALVGAIDSLAVDGVITPENFRLRTLGNFPSDLVARAGITAFHDREPFLPRKQMFEKFADVDAFIVVESGVYGASMGYPVKVFDYLLTGKPILGLVVPGGNTARLLAEMGMTELPQNREAEIKQALVALLPSRNRKPTPVHIDRLPLSRFRRSENVRSLAALLDRTSTHANAVRIHSSSTTQRNKSL